MTLKLRLRHQREYPEDMTFVRMDSRRGVIMMNDGYNRLRLVDVNTMTEKVVDLAPFGDEFLICSWTVSDDERCSLLMSSDPLDYGIGLDHTTWEPFRFELPANVRLLSPLCWTSPRFAVMALDGRAWNAEEGRLVALAQTPEEVERNDRHADLVSRFSIFAPDCEGDGWCAAGGETLSLALVRAPYWQPIVETPYLGGETSAAVYRRHFVICYSDRIEVAHDGQREVILRPTADREFHRLAVGMGMGGAWLAVLSGPTSGSRPCALDLYELDAPPVKRMSA